MIVFLAAIAVVALVIFMIALAERRTFPNAWNHPDREDRDVGAWSPPGGFMSVLIAILVILAILWLVGIRVKVG